MISEMERYESKGLNQKQVAQREERVKSDTQVSCLETEGLVPPISLVPGG